MSASMIEQKELIQLDHMVRGVIHGRNYSFITPPMESMRANHWYIEEIAAGTNADELSFTHDEYCWCH